MHGHRSLQNNFLLDGVDNNSISTNVQELSTQLSRPSIDAIGEFKVVTTPFTAEYGRAPGATISVTTKSGSNSLRGTTYYYFRDERIRRQHLLLESLRACRSRPTIRISSAAASADRCEGARRFSSPTTKARASRAACCAPAPCRRPISAAACSRSAIRDPLTGQNFANNTIPASRIDPVAAAILEMVPMPNAAGQQQLHPPARHHRRQRPLLGPLRSARIDRTTTSSCATATTSGSASCPGWFGGLLDGSSTSAWGRNDLNSQSAVARVDEDSRPLRRQRIPVGVVAGALGRLPGSQGRRRHGDDRIHRRPRREPHGRHHRRRRAGAHPHGLAELHAEVPAHRSDAVHRHASRGCAARTSSSSARKSRRR